MTVSSLTVIQQEKILIEILKRSLKKQATICIKEFEICVNRGKEIKI